MNLTTDESNRMLKSNIFPPPITLNIKQIRKDERNIYQGECKAPIQIKTDMHGHLLEKYFKYENVMASSIRIYDHFISVDLPKYIQNSSLVFTLNGITYKYLYDKITVKPPEYSHDNTKH